MSVVSEQEYKAGTVRHFVPSKCPVNLEWDKKLLNRHHNADSLAGYDFLGSPVFVLSR